MRFDIRQYGAVANATTDATAAIQQALADCQQAGGGEVFIPAGTFLISRPGRESPILEIPANTTLCGESAASTLKFDPAVNQTDFWRMMGASAPNARNITIRDLHLDGSNTVQTYEAGKTPEQNHGIFFSTNDGMIENITVQNCLIENFSGDCVHIHRGCRNVTIQNVALRNFVRQGIQMAGSEGSRDYLVTGCHELEGTVQPGGSTIHVEHAKGLKHVSIIANHCRHSILAGEIDGLLIRDNVVTGRIGGNRNTNTIVQSNIIYGIESKRYALMQFGYMNGLIIKDNIITIEEVEEQGIYVWGKYDSEPSRDIQIAGNLVRVPGVGIHLAGVDGAIIGSNMVQSTNPGDRILIKPHTTQNIEVLHQD